MFIYCFDDETKDKLLNGGYKLLKENETNGRKAYQFLDNKELKFEFDRNKVLLSNKMNF